MPLNILEASRTYRKETATALQKRREIVLTFLNEHYKVPRNRTPEILRKLRSNGFPQANPGNVQADVQVYRTAYLFLTGDEKTRKKIEDQLHKKLPLTRGVHFLRDDCIDKWGDVIKVMGARGKEEHGVQATSPVMPVVAPEEVLSEQVEDLLVLGHDDLSRVREALRKVLEDHHAVTTENATLKDELEKLGARHAALQREHEAVKYAKLSEIATLYPEFPALFKLAENIGEHERKRNGATSTTETSQLPQTSPAHQNVPLHYHEYFVSAFEKSTPEERAQVVKALTFLTTQGASYSSLDTEPFLGKLTHVPRDCNVSRASRERRIVWKKLNASIEVFALARHQDLYRSER